jgi:hypothetical protein
LMDFARRRTHRTKSLPCQQRRLLLSRRNVMAFNRPKYTET